MLRAACWIWARCLIIWPKIPRRPLILRIEYVGLTDAVRENRAKLDSCMIEAAESLDVPLLPLPEEWWDFRLPLAFTQRFAPLSDADLPPQMRCM